MEEVEHFAKVMLELLPVNRGPGKRQQAILDDGLNLGGND
jgi:hypothetical protein